MHNSELIVSAVSFKTAYEKDKAPQHYDQGFGHKIHRDELNEETQEGLGEMDKLI